MEYPVFYTFSTIAQTLAGAIALLGAFALYRLQSLAQSIEEDSSTIAGRYSIEHPEYRTHSEQVMALLAQRQYRQLLEFANGTPLPANFYQATNERARLGRDLNTSDSLRGAFNASLVLTVALMSLSVAALVFAPSILASSHAQLVLFCALVWFVICVISYGVLIRIALR